MPSTESAALKAHYRSITDRLAANPEMGLAAMRSIFEELAVQAAEPEDVTYAEVDTEEVRGLWCVPAGAPADKAILYTHGGGFVGNTVHSHRKVAGHLAKAAGVRAFVLDYRLAPEHPFPAQIDDAVAAHQWLHAQGFSGADLAVAGDSAGGNLAISSVLKLRDLGEELPAAIVTVSPWLDMELVGKTLESNADNDALISLGVVTMMSQMYLGSDGSATDGLANPLHADFSGIPPLHITVSEAEALLSDSERLAERAGQAGVDVELRTVPDQQHVFTFMAGRAPEADAAIAAAAAWLRPHLAVN
ncbi:acetyl esterase/lipase [Williamsia limnetica]|uniref:Acetyl esterase/lipase n=1 Tax=Williamsia limnetica TaxID=882452 RepID=A0A318RN76_WILLI|nr:alpha/beta hydrolase [Williamsia limnetica]PYE15987.1 acetyl esterase/lipase [Williamsia limnetica]